MTEVFISHDIANLPRFLQEVSEQAIRRTMTQVVRTAERESLRRFRRVTNSWKHKPAFEATYEVNRTSYDLMVGTDDDIYRYVDQGTRPHRIEPKGPWPLRFQWGGKGSYMPKTAPGVLSSWGGGPTGPMAHFYGVNHPGTEARGFTSQIEKEVGADAWNRLLTTLHKEMNKAIRLRGRR